VFAAVCVGATAVGFFAAEVSVLVADACACAAIANPTERMASANIFFMGIYFFVML
jgi:hypothetical protein